MAPLNQGSLSLNAIRAQTHLKLQFVGYKESLQSDFGSLVRIFEKISKRSQR